MPQNGKRSTLNWKNLKPSARRLLLTLLPHGILRLMVDLPGHSTILFTCEGWFVKCHSRKKNNHRKQVQLFHKLKHVILTEKQNSTKVRNTFSMPLIQNLHNISYKPVSFLYSTSAPIERNIRHYYCCVRCIFMGRDIVFSLKVRAGSGSGRSRAVWLAFSSSSFRDSGHSGVMVS